MAEEAWKQARKTADLGKTYAKDKSQKAQIQRVYDKLDAEGQKLLKKHQEAFDQKAYLEAIEGYEEVCGTFEHLPCAVAAGEALGQAESIPEVQSLLQDRKASKLSDQIDRTLGGNPQKECEADTSSEQVSDEGLPVVDTEKNEPSTDPKGQLSRVEKIRSLSVAKQARLVELMERAVNLYPLSQVGKRAADDLKVLREDKALQAKLKKHIQKRDAERLYKLGETYRKADMIPIALKYYRQIVQEFPGTEVAVKAKAIADSLEK